MSHPSNKVTHENVEALFAHQTPTPERVSAMLVVRARCIEMAHAILDYVPDCADRSAALRALREVAMWSNAAIVKEGVSDGT